MDIPFHSEDDITNAARELLENVFAEKFASSNLATITVILHHKEHGVNYGYNVHFKKVQDEMNGAVWVKSHIQPATSPQ